MSRSYVESHGRGFWVGDFSLQIWLGVVATVVEDWDVPVWFEDVRSIWWTVSCQVPGGYLDPELDRWVNQETRPFLLRVCDAAIQFIASQRDGLDPAWLTDKGIAASEFSGPPVDVRPILRTGYAFRSLIAGEEGMSGTSPKTAPRADLDEPK